MERINPRPGEEGAQLQVTPANEHQFTRGGGKGVGGWESLGRDDAGVYV